MPPIFSFDQSMIVLDGERFVFRPVRAPHSCRGCAFQMTIRPCVFRYAPVARRDGRRGIWCRHRAPEPDNDGRGPL